MAKSTFIFDGNIGQLPKLTFQPANERSNGEPRPLLVFSVKYDRLVRSDDPNKRFEDKGGFWIRIDYWKRNAEQLNRLLGKGMRVRIEGELRLDEWPDSDNPGQVLSGMALTAESIAILPSRVRSITMDERQQQPAPQQQQQVSPQYDYDIPQ